VSRIGPSQFGVGWKSKGLCRKGGEVKKKKKKKKAENVSSAWELYLWSKSTFLEERSASKRGEAEITQQAELWVAPPGYILRKVTDGAKEDC